MAHAFDTGLASVQRTLVRNGAVALLAPLLKSAGGYLAAVVPWGGIVRGYTDDDGIALLNEALLGRAPSIAIALGDATIKPAGVSGFNFTAELELAAYFYGRNLRGITDGRVSIDAVGLASDAADPGLDVMMEHAQELLVGQRCGASATIKQIKPRSEELIRDEGALTLWAQRYDVTIARKINANRGVTQLLTELRTNVRATNDSLVPFTVPLAAAPTGATEAANIATFTTTLPHELKVGDLVIVTGVGVAGYNGALYVASTPTTTTFTAQLPVTGLGASGGGTVTIRPVAAGQYLPT